MTFSNGFKGLPDYDKPLGTFRMSSLSQVMHEEIIEKNSCLGHTASMHQPRPRSSEVNVVYPCDSPPGGDVYRNVGLPAFQAWKRNQRIAWCLSEAGTPTVNLREHSQAMPACQRAKSWLVSCERPPLTAVQRLGVPGW